MERNVIVRIKAPTQDEFDAYRNATNYRRTDTGFELTGSQFRGDLTVAVVASEYGLELICRVYRAACIPFSLEQGRMIRRRSKQCPGQSTLFALNVEAAMSELVITPTSDCETTMPESVTQPEESGGQPSSA